MARRNQQAQPPSLAADFSGSEPVSPEARRELLEAAAKVLSRQRKETYQAIIEELIASAKVIAGRHGGLA